MHWIYFTCFIWTLFRVMLKNLTFEGTETSSYTCNLQWQVSGKPISRIHSSVEVGSSVTVQFSRSVVSDSLRPHQSQHARPPCPSPTPAVHSLMTIESVMPSSHLILGRPLPLLPPIPPSIRVFSDESTLRMRWPKYWGLSRVFSNTTVQKYQFLNAQPSLWSNSHVCTLWLRKP